jgi:ribonuclease D
MKHYVDALLALIETARREPQTQWPVLAKYQALTAPQEILFDVLLAIIRLRASQYGLDPAHISGRKDLEKLVQNKSADVALLHGWRAAVAGREIAAFLSGHSRLEVQDQQLELRVREIN